MNVSLVAPPAPSLWTVATDWTLDLTLVWVVLAAALYLMGMRRLDARRSPSQARAPAAPVGKAAAAAARRSPSQARAPAAPVGKAAAAPARRSWPTSRAAAFFCGLAVVVIATQSGLAAYDRVLFSLHVVQHVLLGMVAPVLLILGRPVTLALQASGRSGQERMLRVLHSRPARIISHPFTAWMLFAGSLAVLYFTSLYELSLRNGWVHGAVHGHFVLVGLLFMAFVVGLDPIPGAMPFGGRLLFVLVLIPFHTFLGVALLSSNQVLAADWYDDVRRSWGSSPLADQRTGAGLLWIAGELFGVLAIVLVARQWMQAEERKAARLDRQLDAERVAATDRGDGGFADRRRAGTVASPPGPAGGRACEADQTNRSTSLRVRPDEHG